MFRVFPPQLESAVFRIDRRSAVVGAPSVRGSASIGSASFRRRVGVRHFLPIHGSARPGAPVVVVAIGAFALAGCLAVRERKSRRLSGEQPLPIDCLRCGATRFSGHDGYAVVTKPGCLCSHGNVSSPDASYATGLGGPAPDPWGRLPADRKLFRHANEADPATGAIEMPAAFGGCSSQQRDEAVGARSVACGAPTGVTTGCPASAQPRMPSSSDIGLANPSRSRASAASAERPPLRQ